MSGLPCTAKVRFALPEKCREGLLCFRRSDSDSEFAEFTTYGLSQWTRGLEP